MEKIKRNNLVVGEYEEIVKKENNSEYQKLLNENKRLQIENAKLHQENEKIREIFRIGVVEFKRREERII
ncbi:MAG: hypothetical protein NC827_09195 [Candidatus Omnitrophica bacterium]|nr:hypothetical protein [Candidatus Omnitrophota bacterium]MCM8803457.1 hypothetical protein [Candidatus Omnitrophota bacterium]